MEQWKKIMVYENTSILETIRILDESSLQIVIVVDDVNRLVGTVTDGDVRRGLIREVSLQEPITTIMNRHPIHVNKMTPLFKVKQLMSEKQLRQIPIVNEKKEVIDIKFIDDFFHQRLHDNTVILMAGGLGTRLRPLTDNCPKPLLKVGDTPILEIILKNFIEQGFHDFVISVNYKKEMIEEYFGNGEKWGISIRYLHESKRMGTAGALDMFQPTNDLPMIVMNGDLLTKLDFEQLLNFHEEHEADATMCVRQYDYQVPYGVIKTETYKLVEIEEKPVQQFFVNAGIYVLNPDMLTYIPKDTFYDMPELFEKLLSLQKNPVVFPVREFWLDIGRKEDFAKAETIFLEEFKK